MSKIDANSHSKHISLKTEKIKKKRQSSQIVNMNNITARMPGSKQTFPEFRRNHTSSLFKTSGDLA